MTKYERISIVLSVIAILIPVIKLVWNRFFKKPKLKYIPTGIAYLYCNRSGSYFRADGVYEAVNKPIIIKRSGVSITREKDGKKLNLVWTTFISPVYVNNQLSTTETAHPFRIEQNSIGIAFAEYTDFNESFSRTNKSNFESLKNYVNQMELYNIPYNQALNSLKEADEYKKLRDILTNELYWEIGDYTAHIETEYNDSTAKYELNLSVSEKDKEKLLANIEEILASDLKDRYNMPKMFQNVQIKIK